MPNVLLSAYSGEGPTDKAFLGILIKRVLDRLLLDSPQMIEVLPPVWYGVAKGLEIASVAIKANEDGIQLYFPHSDTDGEAFDNAFANRIQPALDELEGKAVTRPLIVPVLISRETEAWMLADIDLLLEELGGKLDRRDLQLSSNPESYANPKEKLDEVIRLANAGQRRRRGIHKADLYEPLASSISLEQLDGLASFQKFVAATRRALVAVGYLVD
ncbi:MAG: DUF4276 family protein [Lewinella sp.]